nr:MAG TPA: hypothetical protein [Caudoviricetes sp.]
MPFLSLSLPLIAGLLSLFILSLPAFLSHALRRRPGFSGRKGWLPRSIRRFEVHSRQILPFCESVIGRENRRMTVFADSLLLHP